MKKWLAVVAVLMVGAVVANVAGLADSLQGYATWTRVNTQKITASGAHPSAKDVYVNIANDKLADAYKRAFAAGTTFVKERVDPDTLVITNIYVMKKKSDKVGDWEWGMYQRNGDRFEGGTFADAGMCVGCHQNSKVNDWVFTKP